MEVGVVNPVFLYQHKLRLSLTRVKVRGWPTLVKQLSGKGLECYALFGPSDLLFKHYTAAGYGLPELLLDSGITAAAYEGVSPFDVERIEKFEGLSVDWDESGIPEPDRKRIEALDSVQQDWSSLPDSLRAGLVEAGFLLPRPVSQRAGEELQGVKAFIFIRLPVYAADELEAYRRLLRATVFDPWWDRIHGLFWGFPQAFYDCVVELQVERLPELVRFVMDELREKIPGRIETATQIVISAPSVRQVPVSLLIERAGEDPTLRLLRDSLAQIEQHLRERSPRAVKRLEQLPDTDRIRCVAHFNTLLLVVTELRAIVKDEEVDKALADAWSAAIEAFALNESRCFHDVGKTLGPCLERIFRRLLGKRALAQFSSDKAQLQEKLKLRSVKTDYFPEGMTGRDVANTIELWEKLFPKDPVLPTDLLAQWRSFQWLRDQASHARDLDPERATTALFDGFNVLREFFRLYNADPARYSYSWP